MAKVKKHISFVFGAETQAALSGVAGLRRAVAQSAREHRSHTQVQISSYAQVANAATELKSKIDLISAAYGHITGAIQSVASALQGAFNAYMQSIEDQDRLTLALRSTGLAYDDVAADIEDYTRRMRQTFGAATSDTQRLLAQIAAATTGLGAQVNDLTRIADLARDMGATLGRDADSMAQAITGAMAGNVRALRVALPGMSAEIQEVVDSGGSLADLMTLLEGQFGGAAESAAGPTEQLARLKASFEDLAVSIFSIFLPGETLQELLASAASAVEGLTSAIQDSDSGIGRFVRGALPFILRGMAGVVAGVSAAIQAVRQFVADMAEAADDIHTALYFIPGFTVVAGAISVARHALSGDDDDGSPAEYTSPAAQWLQDLATGMEESTATGDIARASRSLERAARLQDEAVVRALVDAGEDPHMYGYGAVADAMSATGLGRQLREEGQARPQGRRGTRRPDHQSRRQQVLLWEIDATYQALVEAHAHWADLPPLADWAFGSAAENQRTIDMITAMISEAERKVDALIENREDKISSKDKDREENFVTRVVQTPESRWKDLRVGLYEEIERGLTDDLSAALGASGAAIGQWVVGVKGAFASLGEAIRTSLAGTLTQIGQSMISGATQAAIAGTLAGGPLAILSAIGMALSVISGMIGGGPSAGHAAKMKRGAALDVLPAMMGGGTGAGTTIHYHASIGAYFGDPARDDYAARAVSRGLSRARQVGELD